MKLPLPVLNKSSSKYYAKDHGLPKNINDTISDIGNSIYDIRFVEIKYNFRYIQIIEIKFQVSGYKISEI